MTCYLHLTNGWTASISENDTPPTLCSVAAWPTREHGKIFAAEHWFRFDHDRPEIIDRRCWTLADVRDALSIIAAAEPPKEKA